MLPLDGTPRVLSKLADTRSAEVFTWGDDHVVKLFRLGFPREAIDQEAQNATLAHALRIPTPRVEGTVAIKGRAGIVFERCDGPTLYELIAGRRAPAAELADMFFELQSTIHRCRNPALPKATTMLEEKILAVRRIPDAVKRAAIVSTQTAPQGESVCHCDYHPLNVIVSPKGPMVIDWLDAGTGDPMYDIARSLLYLEYARPEQVDAGMRQAFLARYQQRCRETWGDALERLAHWRLPVIVARLAEAANAAEFNQLLHLLERDAGVGRG